MVDSIHAPTRTSSGRLAVPLILILLVLVAALLRGWQLDRLPPWLWWDEASQGLDARDLLDGRLQIFFTRAEGKEPLYVYLTVPLVAAWDGEPFAVRLAGVVLGALMLPALFAAARALWRADPMAGAVAGITAAALWAASFWAQAINRIGFQVNAFPLVLTLAVVAWLGWTQQPGAPARRRAVFFGALAGLTLYTYLAARITPVLWVLLFLALPASSRRKLRVDLPWVLLAFGLVTLPLAAYFVTHPDAAFRRVDSFGAFYRDDSGAGALAAPLLWDSFRQVAGGFLGWAGDPIARHNIANRPPSSPFFAILFALGLGSALASLFQRWQLPTPPLDTEGVSGGRPAGVTLVVQARFAGQRAWTLVLWLVVLSAPAVFSANSNPHFPRLFGALPAAILLACWPIAWLASRLQGRDRRLQVAAGMVLGVFLIFEGARTARAYFVTYAQQPEMYPAFQGDVWSVGERVAQEGDAIGIVPLDPSSAYALEYAFPGAAIQHLEVDEATVEGWLQERLGSAGGKHIIVPVWRTEPYVYADPGELVPFYLDREGVFLGEDEEPGFRLLTYSLGANPQFGAPGQHQVLDQAFGADVGLAEARWGAAHPNAGRSSADVAAGTSLWVILGWRLGLEQPWTAQDLRPITGQRVAVDLVDAAGHRVASAEAPLVPVTQAGGQAQGAAPTPGQPQGPAPTGAQDLQHTYHLLDVPATQPPGPLYLRARVYDAESLAPLAPKLTEGVPVGEVAVVAPLQPVGAGDIYPPPERVLTAELAPGLVLLGTDSLSKTLSPGSLVTLRAYVQVQADGAGTGLTLQLGDTRVSGTATLPVSGLAAGQVVHVLFDLRLPADLPPGEYPLLLSAGGLPVAVGSVSVVSRPHRWDLPALSQVSQADFGDAVALEGLTGLPTLQVGGTELPSVTELSVQAGQPLTLTLIWRAKATPAVLDSTGPSVGDLVRFVHLLGPDGSPLAQLDSVPCGGDCPATSWLPGEVLVDQLVLKVPADVPAGIYPLGVGWYVRPQGDRLPAVGADGKPVPGNIHPLPARVRVTPSEAETESE